MVYVSFFLRRELRPALSLPEWLSPIPVLLDLSLLGKFFHYLEILAEDKRNINFSL